MALTRRARRRIFLLFGISVVLVLLVGAAWLVRQESRKTQAELAWKEGQTAADEARWDEALPNLSLAVAYNGEIVERVLLLAEARSRVAEEGDRHLSTSLGYFGRALQLAKMQGSDPEMVRKALLGQARLQMTLGAFLELQKTVDQLRDLDPSDREAIDYMLQMKRARGDFLPEQVDLLIRGDRSQEQWLDDLRVADEECALRWALEIDSLESGSVRSRTLILEILEEADSVNQQRISGVEIVESPLDLAESWVVESGTTETNPLLVKALAALRANEPGAARKAVADAELAGLNDAKQLLFAAGILEGFRNAEDNQLSRRFVEEAEQLAENDGSIALQLALRSWNKGEFKDCIRQIEIGLNADDEAVSRLNLLKVLVSFANQMKDRERALEQFRSYITNSSIDPDERVVLKALSRLLGLVAEQNPEMSDLNNAITLVGPFSRRPMIEVILGDFFDSMGLGEAALSSWQSAFDEVNGASIPIGRRVVSGYLTAGQPDKALRQAIRFFGATQSIAGLVGISQAWSALIAVGIDPETVAPEIAAFNFESPSGIVELIMSEVEKNSGDKSPYLPMLVKNAIDEQRLDLARATLEQALLDPVPSAVLIQLANLSTSADLGLGMQLLDAALASSEDEKTRDQIIVARSALLRNQGDPDGAMQAIEERFGGRPDENSRRIVLLEQMNLEIDRGGSPEVKIMALIDQGLCGVRTLNQLHRIALREGLSEASQEIIVSLGEVVGLDSPLVVLAEARHVLEFESDIPEAIRKAVIRADQIVNSGMSTADLDVTLVQLLRLVPRANRDRSIELLRDCALRYPGRFDVQMLLVQLYQETGQFEEAENILEGLVARRESAPDAIKEIIPRLLEGQGDLQEIASSRCEIADRTNAPADCLECIRALGRANREEEASRRLDDLVARSVQLPGVDMEVAARFIRNGDVASALDWLSASEAFENELAKAVAIAKIHVVVRQWSEVQDVLGSLDDRGIGNANSKWLLAHSELQADEPNFPLALSWLRDSYSLASDSPVDLVRIVTSHLQNPGLGADPDEIEEMLQRLGGIQPEATDVLRLAFDATGSDGQVLHSDDLVERSLQMARQQQYNLNAWRLAADIHAAAFAHSFSEIDPVETNRSATALADLLREAVTQFPANPSFNSRLGITLFELERREEAVAVLRQGMRNVGESLSLGQALQAAKVLLVTDGPEVVLELLEPFRPEIEAGPNKRIKSWSLLVESLLLSGSVDEAWNIYSRGPYDTATTEGLVPWLSMAEGLSGPVAMKAFDKAEIGVGDLNFALLKAGAMVKVFRTTLDPEIRNRIEQMVAALLRADLPQNSKLKVEMLKNNLVEIDDLMSGIAQYDNFLESFPPGIADDLMRFAELDAVKKQEVAPLANYFVMATNNRAALLSKAILTQEVPSDDVPAAVRKILDDSRKLGAIVPESAEVMDTRALVALAAEDYVGATEFAEAACRRQPRNGNFRFTLAQSLFGIGDLEAARLQGLESVRLLQLAMTPDRSKIKEAREFLAGLE